MRGENETVHNHHRLRANLIDLSRGLRVAMMLFLGQSNANDFGRA